MKKLLIIILLCWAGKAIGQTPYWVPINNYQKIRGVWVDTIFKLPSDTTHYKTNGSLASLSGVLYICNGVKWSAVGGSGLNPDSLTLQKAYEKSVAAGQITPMINTSAAGLYIRGTDVVNRMSAQNSVDGTLSTVAADAVNKRAFLYSGTTYFDVFNGHYHTNLPSGANYVLKDVAGDGNLSMQPESVVIDTTAIPADSTDYLDSTGQAQGRVLFSVAGRKISSDSLFRYDTLNHKLVINSGNVSFVPNNYKLAINGEIYTKGVTMDVPVTNDNNYLSLNPVTKKQELKYFDTLTLIRSDTFLLRNDTLFVDTTSSGGGGSGWALTGNSGTSSSTNFLGTTDNTDMVFKRNNTEIFRNGNGYSLWGNGNDNTVTVANNGISVEKASSGYSTTLVPDYLSLVNSTNSINVNVGIHGIRPPAISTTLRSSIAYSTAGNIIYNTDSSKLQVYNGSSWVNLESGAGGGGGSETFEQTLQNQGSTVFTTDNTVDFDGHTLNLTNLGGQWNIHGTNGFGYSNAIGSPATPNDIGIYQSTGAYNSKIALHENKAQITADEINISNVAGTDGYTLPTTDGTNGQVLTTDGSGAVSWQTVSGGGGSFNFDSALALKTTDNLTEGSTNKYYTDARARAAISLTTTGTTGAATYSSGIFNIPRYDLQLSRPAGQIIRGTGSSAYSDTSFTIDTARHFLGLNWNTPTALLDIHAAPLLGTVSATNGSSTITGTNTSFTTQFNVKDTIVINSVSYVVNAIASNTSITISGTYAGSTASGLSYSNLNASRGIFRLYENGNIDMFGASLLKSGTAKSTGGGHGNFGFGYSVLTSITSGSENLALGGYALNGTTTGADNTALGIGSMRSLTSGINNTAVGYFSLVSGSTGSNNVAVGMQAMGQSTVTGSSNTGIGYQALYGITSGSGNMGQGNIAGKQITSGSNNIAIGNASLNSVTSGNSNIAIGKNAGFDLTTNSTNNIIIGEDSWNSGTGASLSGNTGIGYQAGKGNKGSNNLAIGFKAGLPAALSNAANIFHTIFILNDNGVDTTASSTSLVGINKINPSYTLDVNGVIASNKPIAFVSSSTPSNSLGTGAGTGATASISGSDADGLITINTGTTPTAGGNIITITFTAALTNSSKIQLTPYNSPASKCDVYINSDSSGFTIKNTDATDGGSALPASKTLIFHYTTTQ